MTHGSNPRSAARRPGGGGVCVITGGTRGIGRAVALELARRGEEVVVVGRERESGEAAQDSLRRDSGSEAVHFVRMDLASLADVRSGAAELLVRFPRLSALVNNAGVYSMRRRFNADGIELTMVVNYLAPYLLTRLLLPALGKGAPARVVNVTSRMERYSRNDFHHPRAWRGGGLFGFFPYARSKRALVLFTRELATRLEGSGVTSNSIHPGFVATDLMRDLPRWVRRLYEPRLTTPEVSARSVAELAAASEFQGVSGAHFLPGPKEGRSSTASSDAAAQRELWRISAELTDLPE